MCMGKLPLMQRSLHVLPNNISTAKFSTTSNHVFICGFPIFAINGMIPCAMIGFSVAVWSLCPCRHFMRLFNAALGMLHWKDFALHLCQLACSAVQHQPIYCFDDACLALGLTKKATFAEGTFHCISLANVSVISELTCSALSASMHCAISFSEWFLACEAPYEPSIDLVSGSWDSCVPSSGLPPDSFDDGHCLQGDLLVNPPQPAFLRRLVLSSLFQFLKRCVRTDLYCSFPLRGWHRRLSSRSELLSGKYGWRPHSWRHGILFKLTGRALKIWQQCCAWTMGHCDALRISDKHMR